MGDPAAKQAVEHGIEMGERWGVFEAQRGAVREAEINRSSPPHFIVASHVNLFSYV